jgi:hypothetical protein
LGYVGEVGDVSGGSSKDDIEDLFLMGVVKSWERTPEPLRKAVGVREREVGGAGS